MSNVTLRHSRQFFPVQSAERANPGAAGTKGISATGAGLAIRHLSAAQSNFASLTSSPQSTFLQPATGSPTAESLNQLSHDLQSGNLSGAQADYKAIQQDFQNQSLQGHSHHHHHSEGRQSNPLSQVFRLLGQSLQSGNLSAAQQAYSTLAHDLPQFGQSGATFAATAQPGSNAVSVTA